ncbi:MAG TPA: glycosyltransferase family 2 protein [Solirubrobacterales bacterium]
MLGRLPQTKRGLGRWLAPAIDLAVSSIALVTIVALNGLSILPAFPVAPLLLVAASGALGIYAGYAVKEPLFTESGVAWPVKRILVAALFAWSAGLLTPLGGLSQLALWGSFVVVDALAQATSNPLRRRLDRVERWVLVGDEATAERLRAYSPLQDYARVVCTLPPSEDRPEEATRISALEIVDRYQADRVVIASTHADDERLLSLVRAFKSIGVPVSLLPRPLNLFEAPSVTPSQVGGVPLINIHALATRDSVPYQGPDRRRNRRTKVSVVVPAINEESNIGQVLERLPRDLHEVILVDGNSKDATIEVARHAYPSIRVLSQSGRGKGDALRTGFAAVTGNLIVMLDADGSADPAEIPRFVDALEAGADFAKGSRFLNGGGSDDITEMRRLGNAILSGTANTLHGTHFTDLCYGYNAFWARCLPFISLDVPGFEVETLINLRIAGAGMRITEVPSYELNRISGESNLKTFRDGFRVLGTIIREARRRRSLHHEWRSTSKQSAGRAETSTSTSTSAAA